MTATQFPIFLEFNSSGLSSETSSYNSECNDDEEIALAIQAAELASRNEARSRFRNSGDLIHRLFVCISGVADQLQTNYASDLRHILKSVFDMNCSDSTKTLSLVVNHVGAQDLENSQTEINSEAQQSPQRRPQRSNNQQRQEVFDNNRFHQMHEIFIPVFVTRKELEKMVDHLHGCSHSIALYECITLLYMNALHCII
ncbi:hypothetical protein CHS0354_014629 [Potamilus streckersoni]|uniref:Uncharacterized protein n=1 Tax=Potamilus streckersoni TaxID=2493646 RepID=A0AAE0VYX3_9BIVA|nr:hypothetical protein CHS0354_014629 [Potamilus streckersoni]